MPSFTIYGKKGGGKSYYALLHYILPELVHGDRVIVTNLALKLPELSAFLAKRYPRKNIDVTLRIRLLNREETRQYWLHRQLGVDLKECTDEEYARGLNPDYTSAWKGGVMYVIDELHIDFDARAWAKIGRGLTYYNSQERKLHDDQVYITQFLELVDKRVKGFSQEFILCRNWRYERFLTIFSKGGGMEARHYAYPPGNSRTDLPNEVHRYRIDAELANCYDTTAGVGFKGPGRAEEKPKGFRLPMWSMFVAVLPIALVAWYVPDLAIDAMRGKKKKPQQSAAVQQFGPPAFRVPDVQRDEFPGVVVTGVMARDEDIFVAVFGRGWLRVVGAGPGGTVVLEDGTHVLKQHVLSGGGMKLAPARTLPVQSPFASVQ